MPGDVVERVRVIFEVVSKQLEGTMKRLNRAFKGFHMELLSTMFFGMALQRTFLGMIKPAMKLAGITELWGNTLQVLFLPVVMMLLPIFLKLSNFLMNLSPTMKKIIGIVVLLIGVFGALLTAISMVLLPLGVLLTSGLAVPAAIVAAIGAAIVGLIVVIANFGKIWSWVKDKASKFWDWFKDRVRKITEPFRVAVNFIKSLFDKLWSSLPEGLRNTLTAFKDFGVNIIRKIVEGIKSMGTAIWDAIVAGFGAAKNFAIKVFNFVTGKGFTTTPATTSQNIVISPTYNVTVSDKREFERMLEEHSKQQRDTILNISSG